MIRPAALPRGVWALGFVSLLMDSSSELIHSLLPVFMISVLGAGAAAVGAVEGIAEATALIAKVFSGTLSDYLGRRKALTVLGYAMAALTKPLFPLADTVAWVLAARFLDRIGKGIRGAPRDALLADITPAPQRGAAFGLRQSLDTVGAIAGPSLAIGLMVWLAGDIRAAFWVAVIPAFAAVLVLLVFVREPEKAAAPDGQVVAPIHWTEIARFGAVYWGIVAVGAVLTLARFSEAFLILRAGTVGLGLAYVPLVLVVMNVVYAASAYPVGVLSDGLGRRGLFAAGIGALVAADLVLAWAPGAWALFAGVVMWGLHMGLTQGLLAAMVADAAPAALRGTAFGVFNLVAGAMTLLASVAAGVLWDWGGPAATFLAGAACAACALVALVPQRVSRQPAAAPPGRAKRSGR